ncbi:N-acetylglucosamine-6-phosphate deacetylase [Alkalicoccus halolimnae]|uniref:N-acetylglucosamine-6-phosphate deacetylase n=1 Tax=Alkalicoccus halolimnae TaxID=1667239 RepID=A0AAJ8LYH7_9BACI|nr:N-acetylglucosamine-6-phosphate deacetylase [Alkalicoccus halolimnae]
MEKTFENTILIDGYGNRVRSPAIAITEEGTIASIKEGEAATCTNYLLPGFIDTHIHGAAGADVMDGTAEALKIMQQALPKEGTTGFLATTLTASPEALNKALTEAAKAIKESRGGAGLLGIHLEGPFINVKRAGAQPVQWVQLPDRNLFRQFQETSGKNIRIVTLAPELAGSSGLLEEIKKSGGIASAGHTDAGFAEMEEAVEAGVSQVTHMFNAMRGLHHRDIGTAGAALLKDEIFAELIADGIHVSPAAVSLLYKNKGAEKVLLITDAMRAKSMAEGTYTLGGNKVHVKNGQAVLEDGTLAGSVLKMNEACRNMMSWTGCSIEEIVQMSAVNPARRLGLSDRKGRLSAGMDADFTIVDEDWNVLEVYIGGKAIYRREEQHESHSDSGL